MKIFNNIYHTDILKYFVITERRIKKLAEARMAENISPDERQHHELKMGCFKRSERMKREREWFALNNLPEETNRIIRTVKRGVRHWLKFDRAERR
jgi:hypothetical protein